jgi:hypothetical protein
MQGVLGVVRVGQIGALHCAMYTNPAKPPARPRGNKSVVPQPVWF